MICPYCKVEVSDSAVEAEDGICPECGTYIMKSSFRELFEDDDFDDDDLDLDDIDDIDELDEIDDVKLTDEDETVFDHVDFNEAPPAGYEEDLVLDEEDLDDFDDEEDEIIDKVDKKKL